MSLSALFVVLCALLLDALLPSLFIWLAPVAILLQALPLFLLLLRSLLLSIFFLLPVSILLRAPLLLLCALLLLLLSGLLLTASFLLLRFSLPLLALILLSISILIGALVSVLVSLLVLRWLRRHGLSIPLLLRFVFILMIWLLCVS